MASNRLWRDRDEKIVILDSSAIMMLFEFSINLEDELTHLLGKHRIVVPKPVFEELEFLSKHGKGKQKFIAKPSLDLAKNYDLVEMDREMKGDDAVFYLAKNLSGIVVTNDRELRKRLNSESLHTIHLRGKNQLVLE